MTRSGTRTVLATLAFVFAAESVVMIVLPFLRLRSEWLQTVADSTILALLIAPFVAWLEVRRRRAEAEAARLAAIVEYAEDAVIGCTLEGIITSWNAGAERLVGYSRPEVVGQTPEFLIPPEGLPAVAQLLERVARGERISKYRMVVKSQSGKPLDISVSLSAVWDAHGSVCGIAIVARDISERKLAEETQASLVRELQRALAEVRTLSGLLPICSACKKIRDDRGHWTQIESYVSERSPVAFTHGICPACAIALYGEFLEDKGA